MESKGDSPLQKEVKNVWSGEEEEVQCDKCKTDSHLVDVCKFSDLPMMREYLTHLHRQHPQVEGGYMIIYIKDNGLHGVVFDSIYNYLRTQRRADTKFYFMI